MAITTNQHVQVVQLRRSRPYHPLPGTERSIKHKYTFSSNEKMDSGDFGSSILLIKPGIETLTNDSCNFCNLLIIVNSPPPLHGFFPFCIVHYLITHAPPMSISLVMWIDRLTACDRKSPPQKCTFFLLISSSISPRSLEDF